MTLHTAIRRARKACEAMRPRCVILTGSWVPTDDDVRCVYSAEHARELFGVNLPTELWKHGVEVFAATTADDLRKVDDERVDAAPHWLCRCHLSTEAGLPAYGGRVWYPGRRRSSGDVGGS